MQVFREIPVGKYCIIYREMPGMLKISDESARIVQPCDCKGAEFKLHPEQVIMQMDDDLVPDDWKS